jgi:molybdate transport system substrate-binding protein
LTVFAGPARAADPKPVTIFAAASMKTALDSIVKAYKAKTGQVVVVSYAASSALAKQIAQGAPADLFISADEDWMNDLAKKNLVKLDTRRDLLGNQIVLIASKADTIKLDLTPNAPLAAALHGGRLAMADVTAVPAGKYGKAALIKLGLWDSVKDYVASAENVRAALAFVARGEAPLGIVYATDAAAEPKVRIVAAFPESSHPPILYPIAILRDAPRPEADRAFLAYVGGAEATTVFKANGFTVLP